MNAYLVDTNVWRAYFESPPHPHVAAWMESHLAQIYTTAHVVGEIAYGIERLPRGSKRTQKEAALRNLLACMEGRILGFSTRVALACGKLQARLERSGTRMPLPDSYLAAVALRHNLIVATRNEKDFRREGLRVVNPFKPSTPGTLPPAAV